MSITYVESLPSAHYEVAEKKLGETKEVRERCLAEINSWLDENPHINAQRDAVNLLQFLRGAKFQMDKAKRRIAAFYQLRAERCEWFSQRDPFRPELLEILDLGVFLPLKEKDPSGSQVFIIRTGAHNTKKHDQNDVLKVCKMVLDLVLHMDESVSIYGVVAIFDMANVTWQHGLQMTPTIIKRSVHSWENYSCKTTKLEFVNAPMHVNFFLDTFRLFMSQKMKDRLFVTRGLSTVQMTLPKDLGGDGTSYKELAAQWKEKVCAHAGWYAEQEKYKTIL